MLDKRNNSPRKEVHDLPSGPIHTQISIPTISTHKQPRRSPGIKGLMSDQFLPVDHALATRPVLIPALAQGTVAGDVR